MVTLFDNDWARLQEHRYTLHEVVMGFGLEIWDAERPYPIFDEAYRTTLNQRIYDHFEWRRIAAPTPQMFVAFLNRRMREQMPAYNEVYKRLAKDGFDPYLTSERSDKGTSASLTGSESTSAANATASALSRTITSNTPASFMDDPTDPKYMSSLTQGTSDTTNDSTADSSQSGRSQGEWSSSSAGRSGYLGDAILSSLATGFLNTDLMVCDMLEPCFMQIFNDQPL